MDSRAPHFGEQRIYYNNFAAHLLNGYNPNMYYPGLPHRWTDEDWFRLIEMIAGFGFNAFELWLEPRLFFREGMESEAGREFHRQMTAVAAHGHEHGVRTILLTALATVGPDWRTLCPNLPEEWAEVRHLWDAWTRRFEIVDGVAIFPGDPGACSRNGCTAETYIDRSAEIAGLIRCNLPQAEIELGTWGPPFFGWGNLQYPEGWQGEFIPEYQHTAWDFSRERADRSMQHLLRRLPDFPDRTVVSINLGFNGNSDPAGEANAIPWANEIARQRPIRTWDFSLTEGENAVVPHYRFARLFAQRRRERAAAPYQGGICFTMTPRLNQLSLYEAAQSFLDPDADSEGLASGFYERLFGRAGRELVPLLPLFEAIPDWGNCTRIELTRGEYHCQLTRLAECLRDLHPEAGQAVPFHPTVPEYREELLFFAELFSALSGPSPDYDGLRQRYWQRVYPIYDQLPRHVDPRPHAATDRLIRHFVDRPDPGEPIGG
ncbi:MAG: hypothetical protein WDA75_00330 [Candidatus Latescibacterota bacterium]|jgi:hypothetical protein